MSLTGVLELVKNHPEFRRHLGQVEATGSPATIALRAGTRSAYLAALWKERQLPMLVLTPRPEESRRIHDQLVTYLGEGEPVYLLPEPEILPFERLAVDARTSNQRLAALAALARSPKAGGPAGDGAKPPLVVASIGAALRCTLPPQVVAGGTLVEDEFSVLKVGGRIARVDDLLARWVKLGYRHEPLVETPGTFSQRGGIIDVYPPHTENPLRVELWDDEVDTSRWPRSLTVPNNSASVSSINDADPTFPAASGIPATVHPSRKPPATMYTRPLSGGSPLAMPSEEATPTSDCSRISVRRPRACWLTTTTASPCRWCRRTSLLNCSSCP